MLCVQTTNLCRTEIQRLQTTLKLNAPADRWICTFLKNTLFAVDISMCAWKCVLFLRLHNFAGVDKWRPWKRHRVDVTVLSRMSDTSHEKWFTIYKMNNQIWNDRKDFDCCVGFHLRSLSDREKSPRVLSAKCAPCKAVIDMNKWYKRTHFRFKNIKWSMSSTSVSPQ